MIAPFPTPGILDRMLGVLETAAIAAEGAARSAARAPVARAEHLSRCELALSDADMAHAALCAAVAQVIVSHPGTERARQARAAADLGGRLYCDARLARCVAWRAK